MSKNSLETINSQSNNLQIVFQASASRTQPHPQILESVGHMVAHINPNFPMKKFQFSSVSWLLAFFLLICSFALFNVFFTYNSSKSNRILDEKTDIFYINLEGGPQTWQLPSHLLKPNVVSVQATLDNGDKLPSWLKFFSFNNSFVIYPREENIRNVLVKIIQMDNTGTLYNKVITFVTRNIQKTMPVITNDFQVSGKNNASYPQIAGLKNGNVLVVWQDSDYELNYTRIMAKVIDQRGVTIKQEFPLKANNDTPNTNEAFPKLTSWSDRILVTWQQETDLYPLLYGVILDSSAEFITPSPFRITVDFPILSGRFPEHLVLSNNNVMITWESPSGKLYSHIINSEGYSVSLDSEVDPLTNQQSRPRLKLLNDGNVFITWNSIDEMDLQGEIYGKLVDERGNFIDGVYNFNQEYRYNQQDPELALLSSGELVSIWTGWGGIEDDTDIFINYYNQPHSPYAEARVNDITKGYQFEPKAMGLNSDKLFVTWAVRSNDNKYSIGGKIIKVKTKESISNLVTTIETVKEEFQISKESDQPQLTPLLYKFSDKSVMATWVRHSIDVTDAGIFCGVYDFDGNIILSELQLNYIEGIDQTNAQVISIYPNKMMVTWESIDSKKNSKIYAKFFQQTVIRNSLPEAVNAIPDLEAKIGKEFTFKVPGDTFIDYDGDKLSYSAVQASGEPLPDWIIFDPVNAVFQGTSEKEGVTIIRVTAKDSNNAKASTTFKIRSVPRQNLFLIIFASTSGVISFMILCYIAWKKWIKPKLVEVRRKTDQLDNIFRGPSTDEDIIVINTEAVQLNIPSRKYSSSGIPKKYICPLTRQIMFEPYTVLSGEENETHTYEKAALEEYIMDRKVDPKTKEKIVKVWRNEELKFEIEEYLSNLTVNQLAANENLRRDIRIWISKKGNSWTLREALIVNTLEEAEELVSS